MRKTLEALIDLQIIDSKLRKLEQSKGDLPQKIEALSRDIEALHRQVDEKQQALKIEIKAKLDAESEVSLLRERLKKYQNQLYQVKTNKEYDAITNEIDGTQNSIDELEYKALVNEDNSDKISDDLQALQAQLEELKKQLQKDNKKLQGTLAKTENQESTLRQDRSQVLLQLSKPVVHTYERIRVARSGMAMAFLKNSSCSACSYRIPAQRGMEIRMMDKMYLCEVCGRILVWSPEREKETLENDFELKNESVSSQEQ